MNKLRLSIIMFVLMLILSSCSIKETSIDERLKAPKITTSPLEGKWNVIDYTSVSGTDQKEEKEYMGQPALFHKDALLFMNYYTINPSFKMKKVNTVDYLLYKYKIDAAKLGIYSKTIEVFSIYNDNQFFMEAIKDNENGLFLYIEDGFYKLEKVMDKVSSEEINKYINIQEELNKDLNIKETKDSSSGVLLGIKSSIFDEEKNIPNWSYSTIWINTEDKEIQEIYEIDELLFPRKSGFWEIDVNRTMKESRIYDEIDAKPQIYKDYSKNEKNSSVEREVNRGNDMNIRERSILKNILYLGNNYISTEMIDLENKNKKTIKIQTVDNLKSDNSINLEDIIDNGKDMFLEGAQGLLNVDETVLLDESNIGIIRKNGYWMLKGRVNYEKNEEEIYKDFIVKTVPPEEIIGHDSHFILWDEIKRKFPNIIDMYSSPNEDIILIRNQFELLVYSSDIVRDINSLPLARIEIPESDSIIMAEWSTQKYTEIWRNEILKRDIKKIEY